MAKLTPTPVLGGYDRTFAGLRLRERDDLAIVSLAAPLGGDAAAEEALKTAFGLSLPDPAVSCASDSHRLIRTTPDQVLLLISQAERDAHAGVAAALGAAFYTTDQSGAWVALQLTGADPRPALERICPLNLHDTAFPVGSVARTVFEHIGAIVLRDGADSFMLLSASSSAASFLQAVETSVRYTR